MLSQPETTHAEIGRFLTVNELEAKIEKHAKPGSIVRVHFALDPETGQPVMCTLQMQHPTREVIDLWVWGEFDVQEVDDSHA
jgi:predicted nucleotidyltransferase